jgi:hypothetical protein
VDNYTYFRLLRKVFRLQPAFGGAIKKPTAFYPYLRQAREPLVANFEIAVKNILPDSGGNKIERTPEAARFWIGLDNLDCIEKPNPGRTKKVYIFLKLLHLYDSISPL